MSSCVSERKLELASRRVHDTLDRMTEVFLPKDPLLSSAGLLPVYYWFISPISIKYDNVLREFFVDFERKRKFNKAIAAEQSSSRGNPEGDLVEFDGYNRSTNDEKSYIGRQRILENYFEKYIHR